MNDTSRMFRPVRAVARRIRLQRALDAGVTLAVAGLGVAGVVVGLIKGGVLPPEGALPWLALAAALPVLGALVGALRPVPKLWPAQLLDRSHGLRSRITSALEFLDVPEAERTAFQRAAIRDALDRVEGLEPKRAKAITAPRDWVAAVGLAAGVAVLSLLEVPARAPVPVASTLPPLLLHQDDLDAFDTSLEELVRDPDTSEEVEDAAREFNQLMEDLADRRLDRTEALRRIRQLERRIAEGRPADAEALRDTLRQLGEDLRRSELTEAASEALQDADAARAERAMRELADTLRQDPPSRAELDRLRQALQRASEREMSDEELQREIEEQRQQSERLLQRQQKQGLGERERRLLERRRRELQRLERERQEMEEQRRRLQRLQRDLREAMEDLNRNAPEDAAQDLEQGAEDLNRMAREQMTQEQMRQLEQQLRQLRELLRRQQQQQAQNGQGQGQQGQQRQQGQGQGQGRMDRFVLRAQGQGDGQGTPLVMPGGQQGQGGQQGGQGQGQGPQQGGEDGQRALTLGQGGDAQLEIPGMGQQQGQGGQGQGQGQQGPGAGSGHDPTMLDDPTRLRGSTRNVRVEGEQAEGPTRSEVILGASDRGFASRGYRDVYTDYEGHAEEVLERDEIPAGYRFYVRRYFQLIRPREGQGGE